VISLALSLMFHYSTFCEEYLGIRIAPKSKTRAGTADSGSAGTIGKRLGGSPRTRAEIEIPGVNLCKIVM
jgi:hypothetical protein